MKEHASWLFLATVTTRQVLDGRNLHKRVSHYTSFSPVFLATHACSFILRDLPPHSQIHRKSKVSFCKSVVDFIFQPVHHWTESITEHKNQKVAEHLLFSNPQNYSPSPSPSSSSSFRWQHQQHSTPNIVVLNKLLRLNRCTCGISCSRSSRPSILIIIVFFCNDPQTISPQPQFHLFHPVQDFHSCFSKELPGCVLLLLVVTD